MNSLYIVILVLCCCSALVYTQPIYKNECVYFASTLGVDPDPSETPICNITNPCKSLDTALTAAQSTNFSVCPSEYTRVVYLISDGVYSGPGNTKTVLSYSWPDDQQKPYPLLVVSADKPDTTAPLQIPLPPTTNPVVFDAHNVEYIIHFGRIEPPITFRNIIFQNGKDVITQQGSGAPIFVSAKTIQVNFDNCTFLNNYGTLAGAIYWDPSDPTGSITNCIFKGNKCNQTMGESGAVSFHQAAQVLFNNFTSNIGRHGGGMGVFRADLLVKNCTFTSNNATLGGGIYVERGPYDAYNIWMSNVFNGNYASKYGGAWFDVDSSITSHFNVFNGNVAVEGGGAIAYNNSVTKFTESTFTNNRAQHGGAVWSFGTKLIDGQSLIRTSMFNGNQAEVGGALYCTNSSSRFNVANTFSGNVASKETSTGNEYCTETCLTSSLECGCNEGCGLPPPPVKVVTDKTETRIAIAIFLPVTAILLGIVAYLLWKTNQKSKLANSRNSKYDEVRLTPSSPHDDDVELQNRNDPL